MSEFLHKIVPYPLKCPHCQSPHFIKNGKEKNLQRYKCKRCNKTFRSTTGLSIHRLQKKSHVEKYIHCMLKTMPLRQAAKETGIALSTAFYWRHKLLSAAKRTYKNDRIELPIMDSIKLPYSEKGTRNKTEQSGEVMNIIQYSNNSSVRITAVYPKFDIETSQQILNRNSEKYVKGTSITRLVKNSMQIMKTDDYKVKLNQLKTDIIDWLLIFRGVATKYVDHYWAWYSQMHEINTNTPPSRLMHLCIH